MTVSSLPVPHEVGASERVPPACIGVHLAATAPESSGTVTKPGVPLSASDGHQSFCFVEMQSADSFLSRAHPCRGTFHRPPSSVLHLTPRNPLTPHYALPSYAHAVLPTPPFLGSSLDVSDIDGARCVHRERAQRRGKREREREAATQPLPLRSCDTASATSLTLPSSVSPSAAFVPLPFPHRFQYSPNVTAPPSAAFHVAYTAAVRDPLPSFCFALHRPLHLPGHQAPIGGGGEHSGGHRRGSKEEAPWPHPPVALESRASRTTTTRRGWKERVTARVDCWRESAGEVGRKCDGDEWRRLREEDLTAVRTLVHALGA